MGNTPAPPLKGRGATFNPGNRFRHATREAVDDGWREAAATDDELLPPLKTVVMIQQSRTIIAHNDSPDIPFTQSINPYQGCEHGCIYCYARPSHAYLDLSPGLDFETRLFAKPQAAAMLRKELAKPGYRCDVMSMGTNTDPYQPIEREWKVTRQVLEVLAECNNPVAIVTKSALIERDIDILAPMAAKNLARVFLSITTLDKELARTMEPRAASPQRRLAAVKALAAAGIPVGVMTAPIIPALNDKDMEAILEASAANGARHAAWVMLRLPHEVKDLFKDWLQQHYPLRAEHVMSIVRQTRGGRENDPNFGSRMRGEGAFAQLIERRFQIACQRLGLNEERVPLDTSQFRAPVVAPSSPQMDLFG
jgi:DNA repair photolyase